MEFDDVRIPAASKIDYDGDGYYRQFTIEFDIASDTAEYYVEIYEDDGWLLPDDFLLRSPATGFYATDDFEVAYHSAAIIADNHGSKLSHGTAEFKLKLFASDGTLIQTVTKSNFGSLGNVKVELSSEDNEIRFNDTRISSQIDDDGDGYSRQLNIEFDVNSSTSGNYYVKVYEYDGWLLPDDYLLTSPTYAVSGNSIDYKSITIVTDNHGLSHGTAEFKLELYNAADNSLLETWTGSNDYDLNNVLVEYASEDQPNSPPHSPSNPSPANGATNVNVHPTLSWTGGDPDGDPVTYDVYWGTSNPPTTVVSSGQSSTSYSPQISLNGSQTYYWRIIAKEPNLSSQGSVWSFTTATVNIPATLDITCTFPNNNNSFTTATGENVVHCAANISPDTFDAVYNSQIQWEITDDPDQEGISGDPVEPANGNETDLTITASTDTNGRGYKLNYRIKASVVINGTPIGATKNLIQDEIDQIRQEYIDMGKAHIPTRGEFVNAGIYNNPGHFSFFDIDCEEYSWAIFSIASHLENIRSSLNNQPLTVTSGYRSPIHNANLKNANQDPSPGATESRHLYGDAADVRPPDFDNDKYISDDEKTILRAAAKEEGAFFTATYNDTSHVHMDWSSSHNDNWTPPARQIKINPEPDNINASWSLSGPNSFFQEGSGDILLSTGLQSGNYTITWHDVTDWLKPELPSETKYLWPGSTITFTGQYRMKGTIYVSPNIGGSNWTLTSPDDSIRNGLGNQAIIPDLLQGKYSIAWKDVDGFITPPDETQTLQQDDALVFEGTYKPIPLAIEILEPNGDGDVADETFTITWDDTSLNGDGRIALYYDTDNQPGGETLIAENVNAEDDVDNYVWNTSGVVEGEYYIYAVLENDFNDPVTDYSEGKVRIQHIDNPQIISRKPEEHATGVSTAVKVEVGFDRALDVNSVNNNTVKLQKQDGTPVSGVVEYDSIGQRMTFTQDQALEVDTDYTIIITSAIQDTNDNSLGSDQTWSFHTATADALNISIGAQGTESWTVYPDQEVDVTLTGIATETWTDYPNRYFNWTVTGSGTETWYGYSNDISATATNSTSASFFSTHSQTVKWYYLYGSADGSSFCIGTYSGGCDIVNFVYDDYYEVERGEFTASASMTYYLTIKSNSGGQGKVVYKERYTYNTLVSRTDPHYGATVNKISGTVNLGGFTAYPSPQRGGTISGVSYSVSDTDPYVSTWISGSYVYASTNYSAPGQENVSVSHSFPTETINATDGRKYLGSTALVTPSPQHGGTLGATTYTVTDNNAFVESGIENNQVYIETNHSEEHTALVTQISEWAIPFPANEALEQFSITPSSQHAGVISDVSLIDLMPGEDTYYANSDDYDDSSNIRTKLLSSSFNGNTITGTIRACYPPSKPQNLTLAYTAQDTILANWLPVTSGSYPPFLYNLYSTNSQGELTLLNSSPISETNYEFSQTVIPFDTESFVLKAVDSDTNGANESDASDEAIMNFSVVLISPKYQEVSGKSASVSFEVRKIGSDEVAWTVAPNDPWIMVEHGSSGTNNGTITVHYEENLGDARTGTITIQSTHAANNSQTIEIRQAANTPPLFSTFITDQKIVQNTSTQVLPFSIEDVETPFTELTVIAVSDNQTLVSDSNIAIAGTDTGRTIVVTPNINQTGSANITVSVQDKGGLTTTDTFTLTVNPITPMISAGGGHTLALKSDGTVFAWGWNAEGQLGNGTTTDSLTPVQVVGLSNIVDIAAGSTHSIALDTNGRVWTWGGNQHGQLGYQTPTNSNSMPQLVAELHDIIDVDAGTHHCVALRRDGTVVTWGWNGYGQLGNNSTTDSFNVVDVPGLSNVIAIAGGTYHTMALTSDGTVRAWGRNYEGLLGNGNITDQWTPITVVDANGQGQLSNVAAIGAGGAFSVALKKDGTVWTWGHNIYGQLGNNTTTSRYIPGMVSGLEGKTITALTDGIYHIIARDSTGELWTWGYNGDGRLGVGTLSTHLTPVNIQNLSDRDMIAVNGCHFSAAIASDGSVWAWGPNDYGQLGDGTKINRLTPVQVVGEQGVGVLYLFGMPPVITGLSEARTINENENTGEIPFTISDEETAPADLVVTAVSDNQTLVPDASIVPGGTDANRTISITPAPDRFGTATITVRVKNAQGAVVHETLVVTVLAPIPQTSRPMVSAGGGHTLALRNDGMVFAWGWNAEGQLGNGTTTDSLTPVQVVGLSGIVDIAAGNSHNIALDKYGRIWTWGGNQHEAQPLGYPTVTGFSSTPQLVADLQDIIDVDAGTHHCVALRRDGTVVTWGWNGYGQLGNNTTTDSASIVKVLDLDNVRAVAGGTYHTMALKSDGTVRAWGRNYAGLLGNGNTTDQWTPIVVVDSNGSGQLSDVIAIGAGGAFSVALKKDGTVWMWGDNIYGQLGNNTTTSRYIPGMVSGLTGKTITTLTDGIYHVIARDNTGVLWTWGFGGDGRLGVGTLNNQLTPVNMPNLSGLNMIAVNGCHFSAAIASDGSVWAWGPNDYGQLGDGTKVNRLSPVHVVGENGEGFLNLLLMRMTPDGGTVNLPDGSIALTFPSGAVVEDVYISIVPRDGNATPPANGGFRLVGDAYKIMAVDAQGQPVTNFNANIEITLKYNLDDLAGINESALKIEYYNEVAERWEELPSNVDILNDSVTGITNHFTKFALFESIPQTPNPTPTSGNPIPEPTTLILFIIGLFAAFWFGGQRRKKR